LTGLAFKNAVERFRQDRVEMVAQDYGTAIGFPDRHRQSVGMA